jgi:ATP-dependent DNA ligase
MKSSWTAFASLAQRDATGARLLTRRGIDWTNRYPTIAVAIAALACRSCLIDGEVVICGEDGIPVFDRLRWHIPTDCWRKINDLTNLKFKPT